MVHRASSQRDRLSHKAFERGVGRVIGLSGGTSGFVTFSLGPLLSAPLARADGFEDIILDPIISSLSSVDPSLAVDLSGWLSSLDFALSAASTVDPADLGAASVPAASTDLAQAYETAIYDPSHTWDQEWIAGTTFLGSLTVSYDNFVNSLGFGELIGNGANGIDRGTLAQADGGAGGLWFGDGGSGGTDAAGQGGDGGAAFDGNGGLGGAGGSDIDVDGDGGGGGDGGDTAYGIAGGGGGGA